jgi:hypothetical protein
MSLARKNFLDRIAVLRRTLDSDFLKDNGVAHNTHNEKARILRNGISIIAFSILEDFIKDRTGEILENISTSSLQFNLLSPNLQQATTLGALRSITEKANNLKRSNEDWLSFIQNETKHIASSSSFPYSISKFSLGWDKSNLSKDDLTHFIKLFNIEGGWNTIQQITVKANITITSPENVFSNAALRRHKAAHNPDANSLFSDIEDFSQDVKSLSFAYDVLITKGLQNIILQNPNSISSNNINIRFLIKENGFWKEFNSISNKAIRSDTNYNRLLAKVRIRARRRNEVIVIKKDLREIHNWIIL